MKTKTSPLNDRTRYKVVNGLTINIKRPGALVPAAITIRVTSNKAGKSLSLEDGANMIMIPLEPVSDLIDVTF